MKKTLILTLLCLVLALGACTQIDKGTLPSASPSASPTPSDIVLPGAPGTAAPSQAPSEPAQSPSPAKTSMLYDPSIFVIEASGSWQQELEPGYFANNECEIYLHKIDPNNNRAVEGSYQGVFWMNMTLDTSGYISDMLKDVPMTASFNAGGEALCDNLGVSINTTDDKGWVNYSITGEDGKPLPLTQDTPVAKGSFVAVAKNVYLEAKASGAQGEKVDYSDAKEGELIDVNYVIHVEPNSAESGSQRKVIINLSGEGFNKTIEGVMRRLPGYPEDVSKYLSSSEYENSAKKHLDE